MLTIVLTDLAKNGVSLTMCTTTTGVWAKTLGTKTIQITILAILIAITLMMQESSATLWIISRVGYTVTTRLLLMSIKTDKTATTMIQATPGD